MLKTNATPLPVTPQKANKILKGSKNSDTFIIKKKTVKKKLMNE